MKKLFEEAFILNEGAELGTLTFDGMHLFISDKGDVIPINIALSTGDMRALINGVSIKVAYNTNQRKKY